MNQKTEFLTVFSHTLNRNPRSTYHTTHTTHPQPNMKILLETPVFTLEAALRADELGVHRIELCSSFAEGGETPGAGMLSYIKENTGIPVFVMIRPRGGDFIYSREEIEVMKREIEFLKDIGADGFVFGALKINGDVDSESCKKLLTMAGDLPCTFHRAFDVCSNQEKALEQIIDCGFSRILTSGGEQSVEKGLDQIKKLIKKAGKRIIIMPGGGMKPNLMKPLRQTGFLKEVHASCKTFRNSDMEGNRHSVKMGRGNSESDRIVTISERIVQEFIDQF